MWQGPEVRCTWCVQGTWRRPLRLGQREEGKRVEGDEVRNKAMREGILGLVRTWDGKSSEGSEYAFGFYMKEGQPFPHLEANWYGQEKQRGLPLPFNQLTDPKSHALLNKCSSPTNASRLEVALSFKGPRAAPFLHRWPIRKDGFHPQKQLLSTGGPLRQPRGSGWLFQDGSFGSCFSFPPSHQPFFPKGHLERPAGLRYLAFARQCDYSLDAQGSGIVFPFPGSLVRCEFIRIHQFDIF